MASPLSSLIYGKVTDSWYVAVSDSSDDAYNTPYLVPVVGAATFTPTLPSGVPLVFASTPAVVSPFAVMGIYDGTSGQLSLNQLPYVELVATDNVLETYTNWRWQVSFSVTAGGLPVPRNTFQFALPGNTTVDLASVTPLTTANTIAITKGDPGDPGTGVVIRGLVTSTGLLPGGFGASQNGYTYRVRATDGSVDELYVWVWTGSAGVWTDAGPTIATAAINDNQSSSTTTYSSQYIDELFASAGGGNPAGLVYRIRQNATTGAYPLRSTVSATATQEVVWEGSNFPPTGNGYAIAGIDSFEGTP